MFEAKPRAVEKKESSTETDEGLGSSGRHYGSGSLGSGSAGSVYLSDSQDWVVSPSGSPDEGPAPHGGISPLLAEETFRYMTYLALEPPPYAPPGSRSLSRVLGADRVEQMTKTYNDTDVVTQLLAERDRDLELAARIGQSLLQRNHLLQERNDALEEQLTQNLDQVHQLQHALGKKDELLRIVASASEESETDAGAPTPPRQPPPPGGGAALIQLESLQNKLQELEEENLALRSEACQLKNETVTYEEKEQQLVSDCVKELRESNSQMASLTEELSQRNEELVRHQEEIAQLLSQIVQLQHRVKELALDKEELRIHLQASKDAQRQLTAELNELTDRNAECLEMLHESQEEIKELRNRSAPPSAGMRRHLPYGLYPMESLAAEIEGTMRRDLEEEEENVAQDQRISHKRVFQTVRSVNASAAPPIPGCGRSPLVMTAQPFPSSQGCVSRDEVRVGRPGSLGGNDLTRALRRLSLRRQNLLCERQFFQAERERKTPAPADEQGSGCSSPMGGAVSSFSSLSELSFGSSAFKSFLPEKLQIVKPIEGSLTLHHWQQLARPHLATILDPHPGVVTKGFRPLPQDATDYRLSDTEEDEEDGHGGIGVPEKGASERGKDDDDDDDEGGITFEVRVSSPPEERRDTPHSPTSSVRAVHSFSPAPHKSSQSSPPTPGACPTTAQSQSQICTSASTASSSVQNPGKCQSSTFSTYTLTTCRILHPSDITQVTASSRTPLLANTPSSLRTGPSTPLTPCRLSLGDSSSPRRSSATPSLTKLVLERGISAQVSTETPPAPSKPAARKSLFRLLPHPPPDPPSHSPVPSPVSIESRQHQADSFLASRPAELYLQDVYGLNLGRAPHPDLPALVPSSKANRTRPDAANVGLAERLRRLGLTKVLQGAASRASAPPQDSATLVSASGGSLLDGLRRNQSLPAMIGAPKPPPHPTSLALPPPPWGDLKGRRRKLASLSHFPSSFSKN
ncbi:LOW QUALITY PROTEIN: trafficking kinesin-binding protein 2 [Brachionichthys hirsutus]|uniref:LOW QUALITY PROTEIN: trafficking kinesin-binding protein 2 n=1 Tax=Brachionichthys hirsutus TaxID=412623 RepID=UPI0036053DFE